MGVTRPVGTRGGCGAGWGACPGGNAIQWGLRGANRSPPNEDKHKAQYISNKGHRYRLRQLFGALRSNQHEHKIRKALLWPKRVRRRERALLGFVLVVDLLEFAAVDAQAALGEYIAS